MSPRHRGRGPGPASAPTELGRPCCGVTLPRSTLREWRNGRRASFRCWCPQGRGGSSPPSRTKKPLLSRGFFASEVGDFYRTSTLARAMKSGAELSTSCGLTRGSWNWSRAAGPIGAVGAGTRELSMAQSPQPRWRLVGVDGHDIVNWCHLQPPRSFLAWPVTELNDEVDIQHPANSRAQCAQIKLIAAGTVIARVDDDGPFWWNLSQGHRRECF